MTKRLPARALLAALICTALVACAGGGGVSVATNPVAYLSKYPLGESQEAVYARMGTPDSQATVGGRETWSYTMGEGYGLRRWSFVFKDGRVYNIQYNDQGPYNGITARGLQGLDGGS